MRICDHLYTDPSGLHFEPPRLHCERPRIHFKPLTVGVGLLIFDFNACPDPAFHSNAVSDPDSAFKNNAYGIRADPDPDP
jgi:hypothetical protein